MKRSIILCVILTLALFVVSCAKQQAKEQEQSASGSTVQQPAGPIDQQKEAPGVADLELGRNIDANKRISDSADDFRPNDTIYLSVKTDGAAANSEVKVRWTYGDQGQLVKEDKRTIGAGGDAWTEFHISKPSGFPKGNYRVTAFINGEEKGSKNFEVQ